MPSANLKSKVNFKNIKSLSKLLWDASPSMMLGSLILRLFTSIQISGSLYLGKLIIDEIVQVKNYGITPDHLWILIFLELLISISIVAVSKITRLVDKLQIEKFIKYTSLKLITHASSLDVQHFEDPFFYDKLDRSNGNYTKRLDLISGILNQFQNLSLIIFLSVSLININAWLVLFIPALVLPNFFGDRYFSSKLYSLFHVQTSERRELYYYYQLGTSAHSAKEIKIFGLADFILERITRMYSNFYDSLKKISTQNTMWSSVLTVVGTIGNYFIYAYIIAMTIKGDYSLGELAFLTGSYRQLSSSIESFLGQFNSIIENSFHVQDFFDFFEVKSQIVNIDKPLPIPKAIKYGFEFKNVSFKYYNSERFVLEDINLTIKAGEKIALVGENGAGKTTLVKLLARLYDPTKGEILLDGINLKQYDLIELRKHIGVIFQDYLKYEMSFSENIAVGNIEKVSVNDKIIDAAKRSQVDKLVAKYPDGYATLLGRTFHQGIELSGGEWQRIALARAYMCEAQLLILDEPTAALDAKSEYFIFRRFSELSRDIAAVFISHKFSTARLADRIIVLDCGKIIEQGTHDQLLVLNAKYAELFNLQAIGYK